MASVGIFGAGWVGLVTGVCFAELGHDVIVRDIVPEKVTALRDGEVPFHETDVPDLLVRNRERLRFTLDAADLAGCRFLFVCVDTPPTKSGDADLSRVWQVVDDLPELEGRGILVMKSTVPVGTGREVERILRQTRPDGQFHIASNPEFLREGAAIGDFMRPDRVVIGTESERAREVMRRLYRPLYLIETPMVFTDVATAELIKYAANAFLATKVTFINEIADLCETLGADVQDVARGIGLDGRIGRKFLHAGPGFGGSCFPKDCRALVRTAGEAGAGLAIVETVLRVNDARKRRMAEKIAAACGGSLAGKSLAVLGLTFKPNTDDMRDAPSLEILPRLIAAGARIRAFDPEGMGEAKKLIPELVYCHDAYQAMEGADALILLTEWNEFRGLDLARVKRLLASPLVIDLRNIYQPQEMAAAGLSYLSIGRPARGAPPELRALA